MIDTKHSATVVDMTCFNCTQDAPSFLTLDTIHTNRTSTLKRCMDLCISIPLTILLLPLMACIALLVKCVSRGPVLFVQEREGLDGKKIAVYKFRTMFIDADSRLQEYFKQHPEKELEWHEFYKITHDPRVIPVLGTFLRKSSLDELPQLFHVITGDMSLVGPRPFPHSDLKSFDSRYRAIRRMVRPGLTGLWQVRRGSNRAKRGYDMFYVKKWSILLDIRMLFETIPVVLFARKKNY